MSDQCGKCELRNNIAGCLREDCWQHDNWLVFALDEQRNFLRAQLAEAQKEIEKRNSKTWCAYCGFEIDIDDEASTKISEHIMNCPKHPIRIYERHSEALEAENASLRERLKKVEEVWNNYNHGKGLYCDMQVICDLWQAIKAACEGNDGLF